MKRKGALVALLLAATSVSSVAAAAPNCPPHKPDAKNVIVVISDGYGFTQNQAFNYWEYGRDRRTVFDRFPVQAAVSTWEDENPADNPACTAYPEGYDSSLFWSGPWDYPKSPCATDSASAGTALSTGVKTHNGYVGVDSNGNRVQNQLEAAEQLGKATGVITSVELSHATPASFIAHNINRNKYSEIANEAIYQSGADVIMGTGHPLYDKDAQLRATPSYQWVGGQETWDALVAGTAGGDANGDGVADPWTLVQSQAEFQALMRGPTPSRVFGVPMVHESLQQQRSGDTLADPYVVPFNQGVPTLEEMTRGALNVLDNDPDGLYLMIECGAVDWADHNAQSGRLMEEMVDCERSVQAVVDWVQRKSNWGETLLVMTVDHETGYLWGPGSNPAKLPVVNNGRGNMPGMQWNWTDHTNSLVPVWAKGDAARLINRYADQWDPVRGRYLDNTEIAQVIFKAMDPTR